MATLSSFTGPSIFDPGQTYTFTATFALDPGSPDQPVTAEIRDSGGTIIGTLAGTLNVGTDAEPDPQGLTFRVYDNATSASIGTVGTFNGSRSGDTYTATWTWTAP